MKCTYRILTCIDEKCQLTKTRRISRGNTVYKNGIYIVVVTAELAAWLAQLFEYHTIVR